MPGLATELQRHPIIGIDTQVFIYQFEGAGALASTAMTVFEALRDDVCTGTTSVITLSELLVQPIRLGDRQTARAYELALTRMPGLQLIDADRSQASMAASLRATHNIQMADAIQVASAIASGATAFVTNDLRLRRLVEIDVLMLDDFV